MNREILLNKIVIIRNQIKILRKEHNGYSLIDVNDMVYYVKDIQTFKLLLLIKYKNDIQQLIVEENMKKWGKKLC